jgi:hypothetical protein
VRSGSLLDSWRGIPALLKTAQSVLPGLHVEMPGMPGQRAFAYALSRHTMGCNAVALHPRARYRGEEVTANPELSKRSGGKAAIPDP